MEETLKAISKKTNTEIERVQEKVEALLEEAVAKEKTISRLKEDIMVYTVDEAIEKAPEKKGAKIVALFLANARGR